MAGHIRIGVSGWRYPPWRGNFYPKGLAQSRELLSETRHLVQGVYLMPSFGRYEVVAELVRWLREQQGAPSLPSPASGGGNP